ncbi:MAG: DUF1800 domain-containing protein [Planctomycetes bacterium]|nr:DUF1800 domain-containing protein [Planctomycetota bacterium]
MPKRSSLPLSQWDPAAAWQSWKPDDHNPWSLKWAGHLYRRAAFGARWEELQQALQEGPTAAIDRLLAGGPDLAEFNEDMDLTIKGLSKDTDSSALNEHQAVWLYRMINTPYPLQERLTLFWHNHFATSIAKVHLPGLMQKQNELLRKYALGHFRPLLLEISRDPAMLIWLDSNSNIKGHANENYAREVMELFTLGFGNYTEKDVQEGARAFTGWHTAGGEFVFNEVQHDGGVKTFLGQTGSWDGQDIVRILLEQPAAARFLTAKLYRFFISETEAPPERLLEPLAEQFRRSDYDIAGVVRTILHSRLFFSEYAYRQRVKSPVEYVVGLVRALEGDEVAPRNLANVMDGLGQTLFAPPNVKGWDGGKAWLNSATLLARHNLAWSLVGGEDGAFNGKIRVAYLVRKHAGNQPAKQLDFLLDLFLQGDVSPADRPKLLTFLQAGQPKEEEIVKRLNETAHTILLLPEYQLS